MAMKCAGCGKVFDRDDGEMCCDCGKPFCEDCYEDDPIDGPVCLKCIKTHSNMSGE
jgi:hypothetical protein